MNTRNLIKLCIGRQGWKIVSYSDIFGVQNPLLPCFNRVTEMEETNDDDTMPVAGCLFKNYKFFQNYWR